MTASIILALLCCVMSTDVFAAQCAVVTDATKKEIVSYFAQIWKLGDPSRFTLTDGEFVGETCYRSLVLDGTSMKAPVTLILSPDQRFVSGWLVDLGVSPQQSEAQEFDRVRRVLLKDPSPQRGRPDSLVTIVEFGDFQCPYCKRFAGWVDGLPNELRQNVLLVFKHLPLPQHSWSSDVAAAAACANFQSTDAFWVVHDNIFREQEILTASIARERIIDVVSAIPSFDLTAFKHCIEDHSAEIIVERDKLLARKLRITRTPTIFVNGVRVDALNSSQELEKIIREALKRHADLVVATSQK